MTQLRELYLCERAPRAGERSGNVVEIAHEGAPSLVCCEQPMTKLEAKTQDQGKEKHVPVVEEAGSCIKVKVGGAAHPMEEKHYIKFIEAMTKDKVLRAELKPGQAPEAEFCVPKSEVTEAREFCTVHGLWKK